MTENAPQKAVIYCRVSSRKQKEEGHGLDSQETRCRSFAAEHGLEVTKVFTDHCAGDVVLADRPGAGALVKHLEGLDSRCVVLAAEPKRLARSSGEYLELLSAIREAGGHVVIPDIGSMEAPLEWLHANVVVAEEEHKTRIRKIGDRIRKTRSRVPS